ncbi:MAG: CaiB/BaiF CoA-transferase family protein [Polaromonas sp.]
MKPMLGQRVIDLTQNVAGPYCTQVLADLGAEVIKIERPGTGDDTRHWTPAMGEAMSPTYATLNRGKTSLAIDLDSAVGQDLLRSLVRDGDIVIHSLKPGSAEQRRLGYDDLRPGRSGLIYCAISAYGNTGPLASLPGYDPLIQAYVGIMSVNGHDGLPPARVGVSMVDMGTGLWSALGIVAAVAGRQSTGEGCRIDTSLLETGVGWMTNPIANYSVSGKLPRRMGSATAMLAPYEVFESADSHIFIGCGNDRLFLKLLKALDLTALAQDERFSRNAQRVQHRDLVHNTLEATTRTLASAEVVRRLRVAGVPVSAVHDLAQVVNDEQVQVTGLCNMLTIQSSEPQDVCAVGLPIRFNGVREFAPGLSASVGQDSRQILQSMGLSDVQIDSLVAGGVIQAQV